MEQRPNAEPKHPVQVKRVAAFLRKFRFVAGHDERRRVSTVRRFDLDVARSVRRIVGQLAFEKGHRVRNVKDLAGC